MFYEWNIDSTLKREDGIKKLGIGSIVLRDGVDVIVVINSLYDQPNALKEGERFTVSESFIEEHVRKIDLRKEIEIRKYELKQLKAALEKVHENVRLKKVLFLFSTMDRSIG